MFLRALSGAGYSDDTLPSPSSLHPIRDASLNLSIVSPPPEALSNNDHDTIASRLARLKEDIANAVWECPSDADVDGGDTQQPAGAAPRIPARGASAACLKPLRKVMRAREHLLKGTNVRVAKEETALHAPLLSLNSIRHARATREAKRAELADAGVGLEAQKEEEAGVVAQEEVEEAERVLGGRDQVGVGNAPEAEAALSEETKEAEDMTTEGFDRRLRRIPNRLHH